MKQSWIDAMTAVSGEPSELPAGEYLITVTAATVRTSQNGNDYLRVDYIVKESAQDAFNGQSGSDILMMEYPDKPIVAQIAAKRLRSLYDSAGLAITLDPQQLAGHDVVLIKTNKKGNVWHDRYRAPLRQDVTQAEPFRSF